MVMIVWSLLAECADQLAEPFRRSEIIGWFRSYHPEVHETTLVAHPGCDSERHQPRAEQSARRSASGPGCDLAHGPAGTPPDKSRYCASVS
jgi:hypothetical protein